MGFFDSLANIGGVVGLIGGPVGAAIGYGAGSLLDGDGGGGGSGETALERDIRTILGLQPELIAAQREYGPQYQQMGLESLWNELMGMGETPGYLDIYSQQVVPTLTATQIAANRAARGANVEDLETLGPAGLDALFALNPAQGDLMRSLTRTASDQLALGTTLDPGTASRITQGVRGDWANRGLGTTQPAQLAEALQLYAGGQNLLAQREDLAGRVGAMQNQFYTQPLMEMLGFGSSAPGAGQTMTATGAALAGSQPTGTMSMNDVESLFNMLYNAGVSKSIASQNTTASIIGSLLGLGGQLGGAGIMAAAL